MAQPDGLEFYQGEDEQWYWRLKAHNGQIVATGGEGYVSRRGAEAGWFTTAVLLLEAALKQARSEVISELEEIEEQV